MADSFVAVAVVVVDDARANSDCLDVWVSGQDSRAREHDDFVGRSSIRVGESH